MLSLCFLEKKDGLCGKHDKIIKGAFNVLHKLWETTLSFVMEQLTKGKFQSHIVVQICSLGYLRRWSNRVVCVQETEVSLGIYKQDLFLLTLLDFFCTLPPLPWAPFPVACDSYSITFQPLLQRLFSPLWASFSFHVWLLFKIICLWRWRDGSALKSAGCSSRETGFEVQHPFCSEQMSVTPVLGNLILSSSSSEHYVHIVHSHSCRQNTTHIN